MIAKPDSKGVSIKDIHVYTFVHVCRCVVIECSSLLYTNVPIKFNSYIKQTKYNVYQTISHILYHADVIF